MTFGHGQPPGGWPPPSGPGPRPPGRRRAPDDEDEPSSGYEGRTFQPPPPPPVAEAPYRPRRARPEPEPEPAPFPPRRPTPYPRVNAPHPVQWDGRRTDGRPAPVPVQWTAVPPEERPSRARRTARPQRRTAPWVNAVGIIAVAVLVGVCAAGGYIMFNHAGVTDAATENSPSTAPSPHDISNRQVDPAPLTEAELSPAPAGYQVVKTQALPDCKSVAVGEPDKVLIMAGCTQVVRATVITADKGYVATMGLVNLDSQTGAEQANDAIRTAIGAQKGRFSGYAVGGASDVFSRAATQLGWDVRGHFLGYCVVAKVDGAALDNDPHARQIIDDLVEKYLIGTVLQRRVLPSSSPVPPAGPAPSPTRAKSGK
jgi:hypothetical protein